MTRRDFRRQVITHVIRDASRSQIHITNAIDAVRAVEAVARPRWHRRIEDWLGRAALLTTGSLPDFTYGPYQVRAARVLDLNNVTFCRARFGLRVARSDGLLALDECRQLEAAWCVFGVVEDGSDLNLYRAARRYESGRSTGRSVYAAAILGLVRGVASPN